MSAGIVKVETSNKILLIATGIMAALMAGVGFYFYNQGKKKGSVIPLPNGGSGIPAGWSPLADVVALRAAMEGPGTDENAIYNHLDGKTKDQLAAIYNEYLHKYGTNLLDDFKSDLSGDDLDRALNYFVNVL